MSDNNPPIPPQPPNNRRAIIDQFTHPTQRTNPSSMQGQHDTSMGTSPDSTQPPQPPPEKTFTCYTEHATTLNSVDIHLSDGSRIGCPYHLMRPVRWSTDMSRVTLICDVHTVIIQGIKLEPIYKGLLQQSISLIRSKQDMRFVDPAQNTETLIELIRLQEENTNT